MKKNSVLVMLLIVLMCISLVFTGCQKAGDEGEKGKDSTTSATGDKKDPDKDDLTFDTPEEQVSHAIEQTVSAMINVDAIGSVLGEMVKGGKITVEVADMIENVLYMDVLGGKYADVLTISNQGEELEASVYLQDNKLAVSVPMVFGDEVYGVDFNTLDADLKNSELWAAMGTTYEEFMTQLEASLSQSGLDLDAMAGALEKYMEAVEDAGVALEDSLKGVEVSSETGTATINGETVDAVNVKYQITSDDIQAIYDAFLDEMENITDAMMDSFGGMIEFEDDLDYDSMRDEMAGIFEDMDLTGDLVFSINPDTQYIMSITFDISGTVDGTEGAVNMALVLGVDPTNSDKYSLSMLADTDDGREGITVDWVFATEGDVDTTTVTINEVYDNASDTLMTGKLTYDNSNGAYALVGDDGWETFSVEGVYLVTADKFEFSVETITNVYDDEKYTENIGLRLSIEAIDKSEMPEMPAMKNILKLTQDEWIQLISMFNTAEPDYSEDYYEDSYYEDIYFDEAA